MKVLNKFCKVLLLVLVSLVFIGTKEFKKDVNAATYVQKTQEYRAAWVSPFVGDIPRFTSEEKYKSDFTTILNNLEKWGFNAMVFHVRTHNNALYNSKLNPLASWWSDVNFDEFDPLEWSIQACHERGIEFHAWMNPYRITTSGSYPSYSNESSYPEGNPANDPSNFIVVGNNIILDPGIPTNRDFIVESCMELVENYDVDAIHFDDYFYISGSEDSATRQKYNTKNLSIADFRREQVSLFIEQLHNELKTYNLNNNKAVELGISPSGVYRNGSYASGTTPRYDENGTLTYPLSSNTGGFAHYGDYLYSDTKYWIDQEWIDYITPQTYHSIDNQYSGFGKLAEWWNWVVEYKKVNLSMGVGIYMAVDSSGGWDTNDELKNQMLIANSKENIDGLCFYKYGSLLSSSSFIQSHVKDLKSFWTKKIPSAVKLQHTNLDEPFVLGLKINGNTLSWDSIDNIRGYMVWKVPTNTKVDVNNIDHLLVYTQDTEVSIEAGYDYYVSSVNLANEISEPMSINSPTYTDYIVNEINSIKFPVTLNDEENLNKILTKYNNLTEEQKKLVVNYSLLETAFEQINTLKVMDKDATLFKNSLKTDVLDNYLLPLTYEDYQVSWSYVNPSDKSLYNLETGEVLVEYLATTNIQLNATLTKNGVSHTSIFTLNVGYVKQNEIGLFYRNTPNALNKEEDSSANVSFIGWSGKVLKFNVGGKNYVFFVAEGNYIELTSLPLAQTKWHSCGHLLYNAGTTTLTGKASDFIVNDIANYGYFIIGTNGTVKTTVESSNPSDTISLLPGEYIFCPHYLDSQITNSVMKPASNLAQGTKVEVIEPIWSDASTNELKAKDIIEQINSITLPITLNQRGLIQRAKQLYDNASSEVKALVTNYNVLESAINELNKLIEEDNLLNASKNNAKEVINNYISDLSLYSEANINTINSLISSFNSLLFTKETDEQINALVEEYKIKLDSIKTIVEEDADKIDDARITAINSIKEYIDDLTKYSEANQKIINSIINEYVELINKCNTLASVDEKVQEAKAKLSLISTLLDEAKLVAIKNIDDFASSINSTLYSATNYSKIRAAITNAKVQINSAKTIDAINTYYNNFIKLVDDVPTLKEQEEALNNEKDAAINSITNYKDFDNYALTEQQILQSIIDEYKSLIIAATTSSAIQNLKLEAFNKMNNVPVDELKSSRTNAIKEAEEYANEAGFEEGNNQLTNLMNSFKENLEKAKTEEEISTLLANFKTDCDALKTPGKPAMNCQFGAYISSLLLVFSLSFILVFKKSK